MTILISTFLPAEPIASVISSADFNGDGTPGSPLTLINPYTASDAALVSTSVQPGDDISDLNNNSNFQTAAQVTTTVDNALDALVGSAPGALDTISELATALADNNSEIASIVASIATNSTDIDNLETVSHNPLTIAAGSASFLSLNNQELSVTTSTSSGSVLVSDGAGGVDSTELVRTNNLGYSLLIQDDNGLDLGNWQVGAATASTVIKRSLGTIATPTPITDGTQIGNLIFVGDDGVSGNPGATGVSLQAFALGDHDNANSGSEFRLGVTPQGTKSPVSVMTTNGTDVLLPQYPSDRNDGGVPMNILYTDNTGLLYSRRSKQIFYFEKSAIESTNATLADYINDTASVVVAGQYEVEYNITLRLNNTNNNYRVGVFVGGQSIANYGGDGFISIEPKDGGTDIRITHSFKRVITLAAGATPVLFQYQRQTEGAVTIFDANIIIKEFI